MLEEHTGIKIVIFPGFFRIFESVTSPFSDRTLSLFFVQFLISFPTVYSINTFEENFFPYQDPFRSVKYPRRGVLSSF